MTQTNESPLPVSAVLRPGERSDSASTTKAQQVQHTPGPWSYAEATSSFVIRSNSDNIALTRGEDDVDKANARLIAAAPDLLEVCKRFVEEFSNEYPAETREASAAIIKAEGRAQ